MGKDFINEGENNLCCREALVCGGGVGGGGGAYADSVPLL